MKVPNRILPLIVVSQFLCTSLWFAGNAIINDLALNFDLKPNALGQLTSAVQFGFIMGTLLFALFMITDRFSPVKVFFTCALLGAIFNLGMMWPENNLLTLSLFRFFTGVCLAGIYPVGMKIASDYYDKGLGKSLGFLVGALVLGTALPHLLQGVSFNLNWQLVVLTTSSLATIGGFAILVGVPNGPQRIASQKIDFLAFFRIFKHTDFRSAAFGYFGHMWELYAFWAFVPILLISYQTYHRVEEFNVSIYSFLVIGVGSLGCVFSGYWSLKLGSKKVAQIALFLSGLCCLISPILIYQTNFHMFMSFLLIWGITVVADSPLFSTLVAQNAPSDKKGTALTIVNCIGFALTILSIQLISWLQTNSPSNYIYTYLAFGPAVGLLGLWNRKPQANKG